METWRRSMYNELTEIGLTWEMATEKKDTNLLNRQEWRSLVEAPCSINAY
jgi:hypothetical protein